MTSANIHIPQDLIDLLKQRRVIPFVGAGFSLWHGLPNWDELLKSVSTEITDIPEYDTIKRFCNDDHLQIAEYLYIKSDKSIGPLRHKLSTLLTSKKNLTDSTHHIELINLNAQQIYTTNYDEIIEHTYSSLSHPYAFVALPKHIAAANKNKTQIVKYHGDLRYDSSLVLTESSYYSRLEFESPMDLKFRSDLLGQSVLFIGYSFRDINIRIIWFKLMEMMKDVPEQDRPSSYIVRFDRNEVLEDLYKAVGIRTIYLDPHGKAQTEDEKNNLLGQFMLELAVRTSENGKMPHSNCPMFLSRGLLEKIQDITLRRRKSLRPPNPESDPYIHHASFRKIPKTLKPQVYELMARASEASAHSTAISALIRWAVSLASSSTSTTPNNAVCFLIIRGLFAHNSRTILLDELAGQVPWTRIWSTRLTGNQLVIVQDRFLKEIQHHKSYGPDMDIVYISDIATRIIEGTLETETELDLKELKELLAQAGELYEGLTTIKTNPNGISELENVISEIEQDEEVDFGDIEF